MHLLRLCCLPVSLYVAYRRGICISHLQFVLNSLLSTTHDANVSHSEYRRPYMDNLYLTRVMRYVLWLMRMCICREGEKDYDTLRAGIWRIECQKKAPG